MTTDPTCAAPEEGAGSGEQPEERPKKLATETGSARPSVTPKGQRDRPEEGEREKGRPDSAVKTRCTSSCN